MESKKILIIGGTSGIGFAIANQLLSHHHDVVVTGKNKSNSNSAENEFFDITDEKPSFPTIKDLDGLIYCPGTIKLKPFKNLSVNDFKEDWEVNFLGAVKSIHHYLGNMNEGSSILFFSSVAAQYGMPYHSSIAASKGAIEAFTRALAAEFAPKIRVNAIAPSLTETKLASHLLNTVEKRNSIIEKHPLKMIATPDKIASLAMHLILPESDFITGQVIGVNGGLSTIQ